MKILKSHARITKLFEILEIHTDHENQSNFKIQTRNNENHEIIKFKTIIIEIMQILKF